MVSDGRSGLGSVAAVCTRCTDGDPAGSAVRGDLFRSPGIGGDCQRVYRKRIGTRITRPRAKRCLRSRSSSCCGARSGTWNSPSSRCGRSTSTCRKPSGKMQRKLIWYLVYRVRYLGGDLTPEPTTDEWGRITFTDAPVAREGRYFFPQFMLESHDFCQDVSGPDHPGGQAADPGSRSAWGGAAEHRRDQSRCRSR